MSDSGVEYELTVRDDHIKVLKARVAALEAVIAQHDLCHNSHGKVDAQAFAEGCADEQRKLYGCAPDRDRIAELTRVVGVLVEAMKPLAWFKQFVPVGANDNDSVLMLHRGYLQFGDSNAWVKAKHILAAEAALAEAAKVMQPSVKELEGRP